ncbi:MAG: inositol monophosphatase [Bacteroidetes bacterium]|nr:MAG: inositol monophosphatase [Bacteroidota bacterium]
MHTDTELTRLTAQLEALIRQTGEFIRREFEHFSFSKVNYKDINDPVSYVDVSAENMLMEGCNKLLPGSGFINEEGGEIRSENGFTWIIDPLDGTTNFTHGVPHFSISVALSEGDEVKLGYVYHVMLDEMYMAARGAGAFLNGRPIRASGLEKLKTSLVVTGFPYHRKAWLDLHLRILGDLVDRSQGVRRLGSAALDLAYVACGRLEGYFEFGLSPWDLAAGALLVQEAGGTVSDFEGGDNYLFGKQILATNGHIHVELLELIQKRILPGQ